MIRPRQPLRFDHDKVEQESLGFSIDDISNLTMMKPSQRVFDSTQRSLRSGHDEDESKSLRLAHDGSSISSRGRRVGESIRP